MKVIIVPGNFASQLTENGHLLWVNPFRLAFGEFNLLSMGPYNGANNETNLNPKVDIEPAGPIPLLYDLMIGQFELHGYEVHVWSYDFRKDTDFLATELNKYIISMNDTVSIITHSQGGLVCRRAVQMSKGANVDKLIMLAPSISGTFSAVIALAGDTKDIPFIGVFPTLGYNPQLTLKTFSSLYQLLPWDSTIYPSLDHSDHDLRKLSFWNNLIDDTRFNKLSTYGKEIDTTFFNSHMKIILGSGTPTPGGASIVNGKLSVDHSYDQPGDGFMCHSASTIDGVDAFLANGVSHLQLPLSLDVVKGILDLLSNKAPSAESKMSVWRK